MSKRGSILLVVCAFSLSFQPAFSRDFQVNPHAPNGYNASMAAYHYHGGAPTEHNGYAASSIRSRHGMDSLMVPTGESGGGGRFSGSGRFSGGGGGRFGGGDGGGSGGRFRAGDGEEQGDYWGNHFRSRCEPSSGLSAGGAAAASPAMKQFGASMTRRAMSTYSSYRQHSPGGSLNTTLHSNQNFHQSSNQSFNGNLNQPSSQPSNQHFDGYSNQYAGQPSNQHFGGYSNQYAGQLPSRYLNKRSNQFADPYTNNSTALRRAVGERPMNGLPNYGNRF